MTLPAPPPPPILGYSHHLPQVGFPRGIHRWVRSGSLRDSRLHESAIPASRGGRLRHAGGVDPPRTVGSISPMGTWPVEIHRRGPAATRPHYEPSRVGGGGGGGERPGGGDWGPVRCAPPDGSPPLPGPVISPRGPGEERTGASP